MQLHGGRLRNVDADADKRRRANLHRHFGGVYSASCCAWLYDHVGGASIPTKHGAKVADRVKGYVSSALARVYSTPQKLAGLFRGAAAL
jgi:hypothetical protein